jgi:rubredoxin
MKCSFCGMEFKEEEAQKACGACSMTKGCKMIRCPRCGYEMVPEPGWIKRLKEWRKRR